MYFSLSGLLVRRLNRLTRSCSLAATPVRAPILPPHVLTERPRSGFPGHALNATPKVRMDHACPGHGAIQLNSQAGPFGPLLALSRRPEIRADKPLLRCPTGRRSGHFGTLQGATGGTQTHSRRTG